MIYLTPGLEHVPNRDLKWLPKVGSREFQEWRRSGLRIDQWVAQQAQREAQSPAIPPETPQESTTTPSAVPSGHEPISVDPGASQAHQERNDVPPAIDWSNLPLYGELEAPRERE
jgi:hypothetical protein